ncbi:MAG: hypothetical protein Q4C82_07805 [Eubacteriales bacterium]|nr:hypothetical protein [Eubacteriales bacterium]
MNDMWSFIDILILGCGVYALYAAYVLKTQGKVIKTFLVFKDTNVADCKDLAAYAHMMSPRLSALGGVMIAYGAVAVINNYMVDVTGLYLAMLVVFILTLIWYGMQTRKAMKIYF